MKELLKKLNRYGSRPGLERIRDFLEWMGDPQKELKVVLIGGTNGKGSTTAFLSSILKESKVRVGAFYSPHVDDWKERIKVNERKITKGEFEKYKRDVFDYIEKGKTITFFEAMAGIAYSFFRDKKCEYAIMEVGMGGRLDATNIAKEELAIITNIGKDHTQHLGKRLSEIAKEKAGIIKKGRCITGVRGRGLEEIKKRAKDCWILNRDFKGEIIESKISKLKIRYKGKTNREIIAKRLFATYQKDNICLSSYASEKIIDDPKIEKGIKNAYIPGRFEIVNKNPLIIRDGAHNPDGIRQLTRSMKALRKEWEVIYSSLKEKDWKKNLIILRNITDSITITKINHHRAEDPRKILDYAKRIYKNAEFRELKEIEFPKDKGTCICGSFYLIGNIKRKIKLN